MSKWYNCIPWFKATGAVILFASWVTQNFFWSRFENELSYLNTAQYLISIEEGHFIEWYSGIRAEQSKEDPNQSLIRDYALKAAQHELNILAWATARVTDPDTHEVLLKKKQDLEAQLVEAHQTGQVNTVLGNLNAIMNYAEKEGPNLKDLAEARYASSASSMIM